MGWSNYPVAFWIDLRYSYGSQGNFEDKYAFFPMVQIIRYHQSEQSIFSCRIFSCWAEAFCTMLVLSIHGFWLELLRLLVFCFWNLWIPQQRIVLLPSQIRLLVPDYILLLSHLCNKRSHSRSGHNVWIDTVCALNDIFYYFL